MGFISQNKYYCRDTHLGSTWSEYDQMNLRFESSKAGVTCDISCIGSTAHQADTFLCIAHRYDASRDRLITLEMIALWSFVFKFTFVPWYASWSPRLPYHFCWRSRNRRASRTQSVTETIAFALHFHQSRTRMRMQQSLLDATRTVVQAVVAYLSLDRLSYYNLHSLQ